MFYKSTRNSSVRVSSAEAITQGISVDGGLFVPEQIPELTLDEIKAVGQMNYADRAAYVFAKYLTDFTEAEIRYCTENAYSTKNFETESIAEIAHLFDGTYMLELWHGPTCAFKDMALQILPYFLTTSAKKINLDKKIVILVATSGDTGKAALEGFKDVEGTSILVFYPEDGVSPMQKRQMKTQEGSNVGVCAIKGNFDDCQTGVKQIFTNDEVKAQLDKNGMMFSSANSINWGRLVPQVVYYVSAYAELVKDGEVQLGDKINIVVPTGNFGNILAAYYAKHMGVPVNKLICASNINNVLTDLLNWTANTLNSIVERLSSLPFATIEWHPNIFTTLICYVLLLVLSYFFLERFDFTFRQTKKARTSIITATTPKAMNAQTVSHQYASQ